MRLAGSAVHCRSIGAQETPALLTARQLLQVKIAVIMHRMLVDDASFRNAAAAV
jgi:hypothetical protein